MQKLITAEEHEKIRQVVEKAEALEKSEEERLGYVYSTIFSKHKEQNNFFSFISLKIVIFYMQCEILTRKVYCFVLSCVKKYTIQHFMSKYHLDRSSALVHMYVLMILLEC